MLLAAPALRPCGEPTLLLHRELPALVPVARYVGFLGRARRPPSPVPRSSQWPCRSPRAEVARGVELRRIGGLLGSG